MKKAIIITASQGLGLKLAQVSAQFKIQSKVHIISEPGVGERHDQKQTHANIVIKPPLASSLEGFDYLVWNTGVFLHKALSDTTDFEMDTLIDLHYRKPLKLIRDIHKQNKGPYHFITIASCSSWRLRNDEAIYCGLSAAKAGFARNFANDLTIELPGSKTLLVNPGGVKTPFFYENKAAEAQGYLDQENLAKFIWQTAIDQRVPFEEVQFLRNKNPTTKMSGPIIEFTTKNPEIVTDRSN